MTIYNEVTAQRILNPTSIDLGEYVINPYRGCEYGCLYCYVRFNKVVSRRKELWGTYVDIRSNAPALLEKELALKKPKTVLLGSTTECFQPVEKQYRITGQILEILNKYQVYYVILTRSPFIAEYTDLLKEGFCKNIYFTFNTMEDSLKAKLEPKSASFKKRISTINSLIDINIPVIPYFSPVLPFVSSFTDVFSLFPAVPEINFEGLNFRLGNIEHIVAAICAQYPHLKDNYKRMITDRNYYDTYWHSAKNSIIKEAIKAKKNYNVFVHGFGGYFENKYS